MPVNLVQFSLFICHKKYMKRSKKSNYLDSHGEEAQKKLAKLSACIAKCMVLIIKVKSFTIYSKLNYYLHKKQLH